MYMTNERTYKQGYSVFGSDGKMNELEYAKKSVDNSEPSIGIQTEESIVLFSKKSSAESSLIINDSIDKIHKIDDKLSVSVSGHVTDGRILAEKLREHYTVEKAEYGAVSDILTLVYDVCENIQETIQSTELRPYGVSLLVGGVNYDDEPKLYKIDSAGSPSEWKGIAIGKDSNKMIKYIENNYDDNIKTDEAIDLTLNAYRNSTKDTISEKNIEIVVISNKNGYNKKSKDEIKKLLNGDIQ